MMKQSQTRVLEIKTLGGNVTVPTHRPTEKADSGRHSQWGLLPAGSQHTSACLVHWLTEAKERWLLKQELHNKNIHLAFV